MKNYNIPERVWVLRDAITCEPYLTQDSEPEFNDMTAIYGDKECYWALEWVVDEDPSFKDESGPPYDAATRTGMYDYW
jgi:hypothetical protein